MHKLSTIALFVFTSTLLAQSPFVGTWKFNSAEAKYSAGEPNKDATVVIEEQNGNLLTTANGTNADGSPLSVKYSVAIKGGSAHVQDGPYDGITVKMISRNVRENTYSKGGKVVATRRWIVSKDGKTMRSTVKGMNTTGQNVVGTDVFDKQ
jgi:hypothetical protein